MSIHLAFEFFKTGTYPVTRTLEGSYDVEGVWVPSTSTIITMAMDIQPLSGKDLKVLPEGLHSLELRKVYTKELLKTAANGTMADTIQYDGNSWTVVKVKEYKPSNVQHGFLGHCESIIARQDNP